MRVISCPAPYGHGGLGQHLAQVVEESGGRDRVTRYYCTASPASDARGRSVSLPGLSAVARWTPLRVAPGRRALVGGAYFDAAVALRLGRAERFVGFAGAARYSFARARQLGSEVLLELESPTAHLAYVARQHARAAVQWPLERDWLHPAHVHRGLDEYLAADRIVVASEYARQSFLAAGVRAAKLCRRTLAPDPRFKPAADRPRDGVFRVVCVGALSVVKGTPLLIEAFSRLRGDAELTLVGGWTTRGMRRFLQGAVARDPRIRVAPGDPLPHLQRADVYVHPSYQDGLGLAALEAMACGVPVVVSEDTGAKEYVREGDNGYVVATGKVDALYERLDALRVAR